VVPFTAKPYYGWELMAGRRSIPKSGPDAAALRGALVVIAGVLVGAAILANVSSRPKSPVATAATTTTTRPSAPVTTPVAAPHTPAAVSVLVLNGVDPKKAISKAAAATVAAGGFTALPPRDAAKVVTVSAVYFVPGYQADAAIVASLLAIPVAAVVPMPTPPPAEVGDTAGAQVVVVVGPDIPAGAG
jgi:hypothetical protein